MVVCRSFDLVHHAQGQKKHQSFHVHACKGGGVVAHVASSREGGQVRQVDGTAGAGGGRETGGCFLALRFFFPTKLSSFLQKSFVARTESRATFRELRHKLARSEGCRRRLFSRLNRFIPAAAPSRLVRSGGAFASSSWLPLVCADYVLVEFIRALLPKSINRVSDPGG